MHNAIINRRFSEIINQNNYELFLFLPKYADRSSYTGLYGKKHFFLNSQMFGPSIKENPLLFCKFYFLNNYLFKIITHEYVQNLMKDYLRKKQTRKCMDSLIRLSKKRSDEIVIIFPSVDPLSIELTKNLFSRFSSGKFKIFLRICGLESRGILASKRELETLSILSIKYGDNIKVGYETKGWLDFLVQSNIDTKVLYWSPWPMIDSKKNEKQIRDGIVISFLGAAKKRKGFDLIPKILSELQDHEIKFRALIQSANFPWPEYVKILDVIRDQFGKDCEILPPSLSLKKLQSYIFKSDLLILPYDSLSYPIQASGLLYHAADYEIPVLSSGNVGFENEIKKYNIGKTFTQISEIPVLIKTLMVHDDNRRFDLYNHDRNSATNAFLFG